MMATPPVSLPILSYSFSLSYSEVVTSIAEAIVATLSSTSPLAPFPPMIIVSSFEIIMVLHEPSTLKSDVSSVLPTSSQMN